MGHYFGNFEEELQERLVKELETALNMYMEICEEAGEFEK